MNTKFVGVCALVAVAAGCATRQPARAEDQRTRLMAPSLDLTGRGAALKKSDASLRASLHDCERFLAADPRGETEVDEVAKASRDGLNVIVDQLSVSASSLPPRK